MNPKVSICAAAGLFLVSGCDNGEGGRAYVQSSFCQGAAEMIVLASLDYQGPIDSSPVISRMRMRAGDDFSMANCDPMLISDFYDRFKSNPDAFALSKELRDAGFSQQQIDEYLSKESPK